jgi:hypothetical protein
MSTAGINANVHGEMTGVAAMPSQAGARTRHASDPRSSPTGSPITTIAAEMTMPSHESTRRTRRLDIPSARTMPNSRVRARTAIAST